MMSPCLDIEIYQICEFPVQRSSFSVLRSIVINGDDDFMRTAFMLICCLIGEGSIVITP